MMVPLQHGCGDLFLGRAVSWLRMQGPGIVVRHFERNQTIYIEGDPARTVMCVDRGYVKALANLPDGRECPLGLHVPGELLGELSIYGHALRQDSAVAVNAVTVLSVSAALFMDFVAREDLQAELVEHLACRLHAQQHSIAVLLLESCERRLAHTLLKISSKLVEPGMPTIPLNHGELGELIGTTRSRVGEFLKRFRTLGIVTDFGRDGVRVDHERLRAYCL